MQSRETMPSNPSSALPMRAGAGAGGSAGARRRQGGFTLLELIIALTLVSLMAVALWGALRTSLNAWSQGTKFIDVNQRNRSLTDLVKKQMASIYGLIAPVDLQTGGAIYPIFAGSETSVQFISLNSLRFLANPGLVMVSYDVVRDAAGNFSLVEREAQYLGLDPVRESVFDRRDDTVIAIFEDLESFSFEYFDPGAPDRPAGWLKNWSGRETGRLPSAISMTMMVHDSRGGILNRHVVIPVLSKPYDPRLTFVNPFETRPRRLREDDERSVR